jgi:SAM-dependent methyltransferase
MVVMQQHWDHIYASKSPDQVSWFTPHLDSSLELIRRFTHSRSAIIDVGAGASTLTGDLLDLGHQELTVLDISATAIDISKRRLASRADRVHWLRGDVTAMPLPQQTYDFWHDRAVFHFLTSPAQRQAYVETATRALKPGGYILVSTFGPEGPIQCSGLEVMRYNSSSLHEEFGARFQLMEHRLETHQTPFGTTQQFLYCLCSMEPSGHSSAA